MDPGDGAAGRTGSPLVAGLFRVPAQITLIARSRGQTTGLRNSTYVSPTVKDQ
jgi:hypothetical protein